MKGLIEFYIIGASEIKFSNEYYWLFSKKIFIEKRENIIFWIKNKMQGGNKDAEIDIPPKITLQPEFFLW